MQWNSQSLPSNKYELQKFLLDNSIHICIISETWLKPHITFNMKGYSIVRNDCGNNHNGVAILIHNTIVYNKINTFYDDSLQNIVVQIQIFQKQISIVSFYSPGSCTPEFNKKKFNDLIQTIPKPIIFAGDFNAHHTLWGCGKVDARGRDIVDVADENDLVLLNDGRPTTVGSHRWKPNALDLTFVSASLALFCEWQVSSDSLGSYHLPTLTTLNLSPSFSSHSNLSQTFESFPLHTNLKTVNWDLYEKNVNQKLKNFQIETCDLIDSYNRFCALIIQTVDKCGTFVNGLNKPKFCTPTANSVSQSSACSNIKKKVKIPLVWWNEKCSKAVHDCRQAYARFKANSCIETFVEFKRLQAHKKRILKQERRLSWENFCKSVSRLTPMSQIWMKIKKFNRSYTPRSSFIDSEWILQFLNKYTPDTVPNNYKNSNSNVTTSSNSFLVESFTLEELKAAIKSRKDSACGLDCLSYKMFKLLDTNNMKLFLNLLNSLWCHSMIPEQWKTDCLVPILKPGKDINVADSYRPITLSSCVGKLFEQLIKQRLEFFIERNHILPSNQFGFRRGRSARESLSHFCLDIHNALSCNSILVGIFFDVVGAYNNVNLEKLSNILTSLQLPEKLVNWVYHFLSGRKLFVKFENKLIGPRYSYKGISQGGILSPLLFILYIYKLNIVLGQNITNLQFVDDLTIYCTADNLSAAIENLRVALLGLKAYYDDLGLDISSEKSKVLVFSKKPSKTTNIILQYGDSKLAVDNTVRFLGVIFQNSFKFNKYIDYLANRALKACNILKSLAGTYWGADPKILLILYKAIVRSHFEYGYVCFASIPHFVDRLDKVQNRCLRIVLGAMCSTPIISMQVECNIPPLKIRFKYLTYRFLLRISSIKNHPLLVKLQSGSSSSILSHYLPEIVKIKQDYNLYESDLWPCYMSTFSSKYFPLKIVIDNSLKCKEDVYLLLSNLVGYQQVYTDGSKTSEAVSAAIYIKQDKKGYGIRLPNLTSIFTAECLAVLSALEYIETQVYDKWIIVSDSLSVLQNLNNPKFCATTNYIIYDIREKYTKLTTLNKKIIVLVWSPSHIGVKGNEQADFLARAITTCSQEHCIKNICLPESDVLVKIKETFKIEFTNFWKQIMETKGKWYSKIKQELSVPWFTKGVSFHDRKFYSTICRLRLGHCRFNAHLHRLNILSSPVCNYCNHSEQTLDHIFFTCNSFTLQRFIFINHLMDIFKTAEAIPHSLQQLLKTPDCYKPIYEYVLSTIGDI